MKTPYLFIAIYIVLAGLLAARVPLGKAPDESAHIFYVQHLATTHTLPVFKAIGATNDPGYEFHQPPLYYAICAVGWNAAGPGAQNYLCRLISVLFGAATIGLIWGAARRLYDSPLDTSVATLAAGFAALWPLHVNVGAFAGNDAAAGFFCALLLYLVARGSVAETPSLKLCATLGAACGLGMLAKSSCLPVAIAAFGWAVHTSYSSALGSSKVALRNGAVLLGIAALIGGPWLARNTMLYGDPLAARIFDEAFRNSSPRPGAFFASGISFVTYVGALLTVLFCTAWGAYGGPNTVLQTLQPFRRGPLPAALPTIPFLLACAAACVVVVLGLMRSRLLRDASPAKRRVLLWWLAALAAVWLAWLNFNFIQFQGQARYVHPGLLPMSIFAANGWRTALRSTRINAFLTAAFAIVLLVLTCLNVFGWRTLV